MSMVVVLGVLMNFGLEALICRLNSIGHAPSDDTTARRADLRETVARAIAEAAARPY